MVRLRLIQIGGDVNLYPQRAVLVSSLIEGMKFNFGQIIVDELFMMENKTSSALPFPCHINDLYR